MYEIHYIFEEPNKVLIFKSTGMSIIDFFSIDCTIVDIISVIQNSHDPTSRELSSCPITSDVVAIITKHFFFIRSIRVKHIDERKTFFFRNITVKHS